MIYTLSNEASTALTPNGRHSGMDITIQNINSSGFIYIDSKETVSSEDYGYRIGANGAFSVELTGGYDIYAVASEDGLQIAVLKVGLE
jgi:hypothetical protein